MKDNRFISASVVLRSVHSGGNLNNGSNAGLAARNSPCELVETKKIILLLDFFYNFVKDYKISL